MALTKISGSILKDPLNLGEVSIGGTLTYQDVTNVDALGIGTFRTGIKVLAGGINAVGVVTATSFVGSGANLTNLPSVTPDKIEEGNSKIEVVDTGTGSISFVLDGSEKLNMGGYAQFNQTVFVNDTLQVGGQLQVSDAIPHMNNTGTRIRFPTNDVISFNTNNAERLRIKSTGEVGIGTDNPTSLLTVGARPKTTSAAATVLISPASGNASIQLRGGSPTLEFDGTGGGNGQIFTDSADLTISNGTLDGAGSERLRITSDGNITFGIATGNTAVTSGSIKYIGCGGDYWNSTKGDYRALRLRVYDNGIDDQYGIGISNSELEIQSQSAIGVYAGTDGGGTGRRRKRITINSAGGVAINNTDTNAVHSMSNIDHGNLEYNHRNGRVLHSNGTGWDGNESNDGSDPILILGVTDRAGNSDIGDAYGLCLHSDSQDNNDYGPLIGWSNRSNSGAYNTTYAAIVGQKTGTGADNNWSSGALHFFTQKPGSYMDSTADLTIDQAGHVMMPRNSRFYALNNSGGSDSGDGSTGKISDMFETELVDSNGDYNTSNGRFTAPVDGKYEFHFAALHRSLGSAGSGELTFYKNGSNLSSRSFGYSNIGSGGSTSDHQHMHIHGIFALSAGDYIEVYIYAQSSGMDFYTFQGLGYFSGKLLG